MQADETQDLRDHGHRKATVRQLALQPDVVLRQRSDRGADGLRRASPRRHRNPPLFGRVSRPQIGCRNSSAAHSSFTCRAAKDGEKKTPLGRWPLSMTWACGLNKLALAGAAIRHVVHADPGLRPECV